MTTAQTKPKIREEKSPRILAMLKKANADVKAGRLVDLGSFVKPIPKKTTVRVDRLRKLADFLDKLPVSHFRFSVIRLRVPVSKDNECGTVGCAIGWCPNVFPKLCRVDSDDLVESGAPSRDYDHVGANLFNMTVDHAAELFGPCSPSPATGTKLGPYATPKQVARRIRTYATWAEKNGVRP